MFGDAFEKGLTIKMEQTHVPRFLPELLDHIEDSDLQPDVIISHRMKLPTPPLATRCSAIRPMTVARWCSPLTFTGDIEGDRPARRLTSPNKGACSRRPCCGPSYRPGLPWPDTCAVAAALSSTGRNARTPGCASSTAGVAARATRTRRERFGCFSTSLLSRVDLARRRCHPHHQHQARCR